MAFLSSLQRWLFDTSQPLRPLRYIILLFYRLLDEMIHSEFKERAQSLTYTTLLSLVPLLAISFSILKGFGVHHSLIPLLYDGVSVLGEERASHLVSTVIGLVDNVKGAVLGGVGLLVLFYTVVGLITTIERAFNRIWRVSKGRKIQTRLANYLIIILMGPVFIFAITSIFSSAVIDQIMMWLPYPSLKFLVSKGLTITLVTFIIFVIYVFMPHSKVNVFPAFLGALIAANLWYFTGQLFTLFVVNSGKQAIIYSGFASIVLFIMWLYLSWLIILIGNQLTYFFQNPERLLSKEEGVQKIAKMEVTLALEPLDESHKNWQVTTIKTEQVPTEVYSSFALSMTEPEGLDANQEKSDTDDKV